MSGESFLGTASTRYRWRMARQGKVTGLGLAMAALTLVATLLLPGIAGAQTFEVVHEFSFWSGDGAFPHAGLIEISPGQLVGTTRDGGDYYEGLVYTIDTSGDFEPRVSFMTYADGPYSELTLSSDGFLYGTTPAAGYPLGGIVFRLHVDDFGLWSIEPLHSFDGADGALPTAPIIEGSDGNFYGTTVRGGDFDLGTVFSMDRDGNVTSLHSFSQDEGNRPWSALVQASDDYFYGTTQSGGDFNRGTVFKMDFLGNITPLHSFNLNEGAIPTAPLIIGSDGYFYGTTLGGTPFSHGTIFRMDSSGNITTLHAFNGSDGSGPWAALIKASDGNFYGTTYKGGGYDLGTIFRMDRDGNVWPMHSFDEVGGKWPYARLLEASDHYLYGTAYGGIPQYGTTTGYGVVFRIGPISQPPSNQPPVLDPVGDWSVEEGVTLEFWLSAIDYDGGVLTFSMAPGTAPPGANLDPANGHFTYTPEYDVSSLNDDIDFDVVFVVTDPLSAWASQTARITVLDVAGGTRPGIDVSIAPIDTTTGTTPVTVTFGEVTAPGVTTVTPYSTGLPPPAGFAAGSPPLFWDVSTTATFSGEVNLCFTYDESRYADETTLRLFDREGSAWVDITTSLDTVANVICGTTSSLPIFAIFERGEDVKPPCPELVGRWPYGPVYAVAVDGDYAFFGTGTVLQVAAVSTPAAPEVVGEVVLPAVVQGIAVSGSYCYVVAGSTLHVIDVSIPRAPFEVGSYDSAVSAREVAVANGYAYVVGGGLRVIDVSVPYSPVAVGHLSTPGSGVGVAVSGSYAYVADSSGGLRVIDVSEPSLPLEVGFFDTPTLSYVQDVAVSDGYAYLASYQTGLRIVDVSTPTSPVEVGYYQPSSTQAFGVAVSGAYAYMADYSTGLRVIDVADPSMPTQVGGCDTPGLAYGVAVVGTHVFVADHGGGLRVIDSSVPSSPVVVGYSDTPGSSGKIAAAGTDLYVTGYYTGFQVIDAANPVSPVSLGNSYASEVKGVAISGNLVYLAELHAGVRIVDVSSPLAPVDIGRFSASGIYAFDVAVSGNLAYIADYYNGLRIVDVSVPSAPVQVGHLSTPGYPRCVAVSGPYVYVSGNSGVGLRVIDASSPSAPVEVGVSAIPVYVEDLEIAGSFAYVTDGSSGIRIFDVSSPSAPMEISWFDTPGSAVAVAVSGRFAYVADYPGGLQVIDVSTPEAPLDAGYHYSYGVGHVATSNEKVYVTRGDAGIEILDLCSYNHPPLFDEIGDWTIVEGDTLELWLNASDVDGDPLTFSMESASAPPGATVDPATGLFRYSPGSDVSTPDSNTVIEVVFRVDDGNSGTDSQTCRITVLDVPPCEPASIAPSAATRFCDGGSVTLVASDGNSWLWSTGETSQGISVESTGTYAVTVYQASGCEATAAVDVIVDPLPVATVATLGPTTFCDGGEVTLTASDGVEFLWSDGAATQSTVVTATGEYSVTVRDVNGCAATSTPTTVHVNPLPLVTISPSGPTRFCSGGTVTLTASDGTSFAWSNGATTQSTQAAIGGSYWVTVHDINGCAAKSSPTLVAVDPLPVVSISPAGPTTFCEGENVTLTANPMGGIYVWSTGEVGDQLSVDSSGDYSLIATNEFGCSAPSNAVQVTTNPLPAVPSITTVSTGGVATLTSSPEYSHLWSTGETSQSISTTQNGQYTVTVSNVHECSATSNPSTVEIAHAGQTIFSANGVTAEFSSMPDGAVFTADVINNPLTVTPLPAGYYQIVAGVEQQLVTAYELNIDPPSEGRVEIAINVPWVTSFKELKSLRVLHGEVDPDTGDVVLVDRTSRHEFDRDDPSNSIVIARVTSLSPFVVARVKRPTIGVIDAPPDPVELGGFVAATATFTDPDPDDVHTATWDWGDGSTSDGTVTEPEVVGGEEIDGLVTGEHTYSAPGVYTVHLFIDDNTSEGGIGSAVYEYVVVYDPDGGFVTGGGWITSPPGAYPVDPTLTGKANFGFVAKYKKGANVPDGNTEFRFNAAGLNFQSSSYQWLVVAGAKAKFKGIGTVNGAESYGFLISAIDGQINGGGGQDKFRMKIWEVASGDLVYDNQLDVPEDADPTTTLGGGSIVIHRN